MAATRLRYLDAASEAGVSLSPTKRAGIQVEARTLESVARMVEEGAWDE
jgi:hypothetical protein